MKGEPIRLPRGIAKPCPWCGTQPRAQPWHGGAPTQHMVSCWSDPCPSSPSVTGETLDQALKAWNKRKSLPPSRAAQGGEG